MFVLGKLINMHGLRICHVRIVFTSNQQIVMSNLANRSRYACTVMSNIQLLVVYAKI